MSRNLHNTDYIFQPKRGLAADLNSTSNKNSAVDGELAYTTDRKQLNIYNGTQFEEVNKYTQYFFNSSGSQSGNRFNDFADMQESIGGREVRIQFEQDETLPAGAFNVDFQTWVGPGTNPNEGPTITCPSGFTFSSALNWGCENGLNIISTSNVPIYVQDVVTTHGIDRCDISCTTKEFFKITADGIQAFFVANGGGFRNAGYEVINVEGTTPYNCYPVVTAQGIQGVIENNIIRSNVEVVYLELKQSSEATSGVTTQANLYPGSAFSSQLFSNAAVVGFLEGQPTGIASDNVSDALAELYAGKVELVAVPSSASDTGVAGSMAYDGSYLYVCSATDTWVRTPLATW